MGTDFNVRPVGGSVATPYIAHAPEGARAAVPTELPPEKAVTAPDVTVRARNNPQPEAERLSRQVVLDRDAAELVYRVVDSRTSLVVKQFPDEARLRARAYLRSQDLARQSHTERQTDRRA